VDVVVRDKKGPVMDLAQDEFTVLGGRQAAADRQLRQAHRAGDQATPNVASIAAGVAKPNGLGRARRWSHSPSIA
jgi:hypothetical protein